LESDNFSFLPNFLCFTVPHLKYSNTIFSIKELNFFINSTFLCFVSFL